MVERYEPVAASMATAFMEKTEGGGWVDYDDYAAALELKEKLLLDTGNGCSICGHTPVVNIPGGSGTYWLCGDCVAEKLDTTEYAHGYESKAREDMDAENQRLQSKLNRYRELTVTAPHDAGRICTICKACWANSRGAELHEEWCPSWEPPK